MESQHQRARHPTHEQDGAGKVVPDKVKEGSVHLEIFLFQHSDLFLLVGLADPVSSKFLQFYLCSEVRI